MTGTATASATPPGAISRDPVEWNAIDWRNANRIVRRLQARIVKATQEGKCNRVKVLQRLLTHSFSAKALAVKRVTDNQGHNTPGVDRVRWNTPEKKQAAIGSLGSRGYRPLPLRRVYIPKSNGTSRPLGIPTMKDRAMQALYLLALDPIAETTGDPNSYGFRSERSTADAIQQCFIALAGKGHAEWVLEGDIESCFDRISHQWVLDHIPLDKSILQKWLKAGYIEKNVLHPTDEGTPQGGIISPAIANMVLDGLERQLRASEGAARRITGTSKAKVHFIRYADDFIVTGPTREVLEREVKPIVEQFMMERGLELSAEKTVITHIEDGFDFLGQTIRKFGGKLLIKPSKKSIKSFLRTVRSTVKALDGAPAFAVVAKLNPIIRGWANYHRHVASHKAFYSVDHQIHQALWRWARRRHPHKGARWIRRKYFHTVGRSHWIFSGTMPTVGGPRTVHLIKAYHVKFRPHVKVLAAVNPYDPKWNSYLAQRHRPKRTSIVHV